MVVFFCILFVQPSLGHSSCTSPEFKSLKQREQKKAKKHKADHDESIMDVEADDDYEFIPGTPPNKKVNEF